MGVVSRSLRKVYAKLNEMEQSNTSNRNKYPHLKFEELPDPYSQPEKIIQKSQRHKISIGDITKVRVGHRLLQPVLLELAKYDGVLVL